MAGKRKRGEGTVRLRKDGRWEGRVVVGYDEAGDPKTKNVLAKTKKECVEKLELLKEQCDDRRPTQVRPDMPFGAWMDYWYQNFSKPRLRPTTQLSYEGWIYNHLIPGLGHIQLNRLTQADLQQFFRTMKESGRKSNVDKRGKGMADRSVRSCHAVCQMALDRAVEEKLIHGNPAAGCRLPPIKGREMQVLTQEEMRRFLIQAKAEGMYELFLLDLTTGMRRGELLALRWDDLDFATGKLRIDKQVCPVGGKLIVSEPKTKAANRTIILPPAMLEVLAEYKKDQNATTGTGRLEEVRQYILAHYTENDLTAASIAASFSMSSSYLSRAFKEYTGSNILEYIQRLRVNTAKELLRTESVKTTAQQVGFWDTQGLVRAFKKHEGMTPSEFKHIREKK